MRWTPALQGNAAVAEGRIAGHSGIWSGWRQKKGRTRCAVVQIFIAKQRDSALCFPLRKPPGAGHCPLIPVRMAARPFLKEGTGA
ncbi:hypothetical protein GKC28_00775 [Leisingera sp. ANG59]|nr:hypothetical protein [Leisingera sp. ANG59]